MIDKVCVLWGDGGLCNREKGQEEKPENSNGTGALKEKRGESSGC